MQQQQKTTNSRMKIKEKLLFFMTKEIFHDEKLQERKKIFMEISHCVYKTVEIIMLHANRHL